MIGQTTFGLLRPLGEERRRVELDTQRQDFFENSQGVFEVIVVAAAIVQPTTDERLLPAQTSQQHPPQSLHNEIQWLPQGLRHGLRGAQSRQGYGELRVQA